MELSSQESFIEHFTQLDDPELLNEIWQFGKVMTVEEGGVILRKDAYVKVVPLVLSGLVKVLQEGEMHDTLMYYLEPGDSCIMSVTACFNNEKSKVKAVVEEEVLLVAIPAETVVQWQSRYPVWNEFVTTMYRKRFLNLLDGFNSVVYDGIEGRLRSYLLQRAKTLGTRELRITHKQIAEDLGTAREVVSRLLKVMETKGQVAISRGKLQLLTL